MSEEINAAHAAGIEQAAAQVIEQADLADGQAARANSAAPKRVESTSSVIAAILANIGVGVVKFIAAAVSGSSAMISEGIHSIVDSGNGLLILFGMKRAEHKPDITHPFGYSQELYFWTLVVAVMIFALGGGLSIYEGIQHIAEITPETKMGDPTLSYIVIFAAMVIEGFSMTVALRSFNKARGKTGPLRFISEATDPSLFTVVLEDSAAELGLIFALAGVFFGHMFNNPYLDAGASLLIGLLLCTVSVILLRETKGLLIGEGLLASELREVEELVLANPLVVECGRILTLYLGPADMLMTIDVTFAPHATRNEIDRAIDDIEYSLVNRFPQTTRIFIEVENLRQTRQAARRTEELLTQD